MNNTPTPHHSNVPASYLVLTRDDEVLLLKRKNTGFEDGNYGLVAGHVDPGETFTQAAIREAKEEAGIVLHKDDLKVGHMMHRKSTDGEKSERVDVFFVATRWDGEIINREPEKCDELAWYAKDRLPENTIGYIRKVFENIEKGIFYSEFNWN